MHKIIISGIFWLACGLLFTIWSTTYEIGSLLQPGPGLYPLVLGPLLIPLSLISYLDALKSLLLLCRKRHILSHMVYGKRFLILS